MLHDRCPVQASATLECVAYAGGLAVVDVSTPAELSAAIRSGEDFLEIKQHLDLRDTFSVCEGQFCEGERQVHLPDISYSTNAIRVRNFVFVCI
jgi:hypothetical protein